VRGCVPQPLQDVQFGRDAGAPSYNAVRTGLGLAPPPLLVIELVYMSQTLAGSAVSSDSELLLPSSR
jgi:hypothetical protein